MVKTKPKQNFKLSKAVLDLETLEEDDEHGAVSIWVHVNGKKTLLCNLNRNTSQTQIDVAFGKEHTLEFFMRGPPAAQAHLSGYYIYDEECSSDDDSYQFANSSKNHNNLILMCVSTYCFYILLDNPLQSSQKANKTLSTKRGKTENVNDKKSVSEDDDSPFASFGHSTEGILQKTSVFRLY